MTTRICICYNKREVIIVVIVMKQLNIKDMYLELTRRCTLKCLHCLRGECQNLDMSEEIIDNAFKDVSFIQKLTLGGGEPLLVPKVIEIVKNKIEEYGITVMEIDIITNGTVLAEDAIKVISDLQKIAQVNVGVSRDSFHLLALANNIKLSQRQKNNRLKFIELLGYDPFGRDLFTLALDETEPITRVGRALNLTQADLDRISKQFGKHIFFDPLADTSIPEFKMQTFRIPGKDRKISIVNSEFVISATGFICPPDQPYEEEDKSPYGMDIKDKSLLEALEQYQIMRQASLKQRNFGKT